MGVESRGWHRDWPFISTNNCHFR